MSTVADYVNRLSDYLAFQPLGTSVRGFNSLPLVQQLVGADSLGALTAGIQKAVQRFLIVLLTKKGSVPFDAEEGTILMIAAEQGLWRTVADVEQTFYTARLDAVRQVTSVELDTDPDDEKFADAVLTGVTLSGDMVSLAIMYTTQAGSSYTYLTPIQVPIH